MTNTVGITYEICAICGAIIYLELVGPELTGEPADGRALHAEYHRKHQS